MSSLARGGGGGLPVALVGLRGSGKTTVGRALAGRLALAFSDLDDEVALIAGAPSAGAVIEELGLEAFRRLEARALERVLTDALRAGPLVLATGGGAVESPVNRQWLALRTRCVWLRAGAAVLRERLAADPTHRPSLTGADPLDELDELERRRAPLYTEVAHIEVDAERSKPSELACRIADALGPAGG